jgi:hypothetical protein
MYQILGATYGYNKAIHPKCLAFQKTLISPPLLKRSLRHRFMKDKDIKEKRIVLAPDS